ncbi:hypothetical protein [Clostridium thermobutyricum]|nr:hypothetical protein [Clostridium thermobutyricum]
MSCDNTVECPCKNLKCENRGICCKCVARHSKTDVLPACLRHISNIPVNK